VAGSYENGNEPSQSIKGKEFIDHFSDFHPLKMDSACWN
jgi:hypothetical protein